MSKENLYEVGNHNRHRCHCGYSSGDYYEAEEHRRGHEESEVRVLPSGDGSKKTRAFPLLGTRQDRTLLKMARRVERKLRKKSVE